MNVPWEKQEAFQPDRKLGVSILVTAQDVRMLKQPIWAECPRWRETILVSYPQFERQMQQTCCLLTLGMKQTKETLFLSWWKKQNQTPKSLPLYLTKIVTRELKISDRYLGWEGILTCGASVFFVELFLFEQFFLDFVLIFPDHSFISFKLKTE